MRFVLYTNHYSPHELPLFQACAKTFDEAVYVVDRGWEGEASRKGWQPGLGGAKTLVLDEIPQAERASALVGLLDKYTLIMYGTRGNPYEANILSSSSIVIYASERWLKPMRFIPGWVRLLIPSFMRSVLRMRRFLRANPRFFYFGLGIHAVEDMAWLMGFGRANCPDRTPCSRVPGRKGVIPSLRLWGYFVAPALVAAPPPGSFASQRPLRVLWVGRMLGWKRVDTLVKAVAKCSRLIPVELTLVGEGPERENLERLARRTGASVSVRGFVPMEEVRALMKTHDIYVLPSSGYEGWGAVANEALEANMVVLASRETGAGATLLPEECLFSAGNVDELAEKIRTVRTRPGIGCWTPGHAAARLRAFAEEICNV